MAKITGKKVLRNAKAIKGIYVMGGFGNGQYDCSGFVSAACELGSHVYTGALGNFNGSPVLRAHGFKDVSNKVDLSSGRGMKPGDVLIYNKEGTDGSGANGHTEIYYGNGLTIGARTSGQPVGLEGGLVSVYRSPPRTWQECWRAPGGISIIKWQPTNS